MTLVDNIVALATAIKNRINNDVFPRLVPTGGTTGQVLTKYSDNDLEYYWTTATGGGTTASGISSLMVAIGDLPDASSIADGTICFVYEE